MDILEIAEQAHYEIQQEREAEKEAQEQKENDREERDCSICDIAEDTYEYIKNKF